jgi:hypothetical protein
MKVRLAKLLLKAIRRLVKNTEYSLINGMIRKRPVFKYEDKQVYYPS